MRRPAAHLLDAADELDGRTCLLCAHVVAMLKVRTHVVAMLKPGAMQTLPAMLKSGVAQEISPLPRRSVRASVRAMANNESNFIDDMMAPWCEPVPDPSG